MGRGLEVCPAAEISPGALEGIEVGGQADFRHGTRPLIASKGGVGFFFLTVVKAQSTLNGRAQKEAGSFKIMEISGGSSPFFLL